ncbi:fibronectin type III domain-containing protein [Streptomyces sp. NBC_01275]|uniref:fibronectin type III domain-containing protein n=1 Tax=Streptomyces sp. NBC_01275 TaxID=2903807 RepID=UPI002250580E|nr:fibronectin type III domain-containing protein [Streptomyces sp. NBC_01275]MCX4766872.1 fibronectin type III domain-containing protein [Streptomyces sp. NBC_01275]
MSTTALLDASLAAAADGTPGTLSADPLATWQTDGIVWSLASANGVVYVGGTFDSVRPPGAAPGQRQVARHNLAAFDAVTGNLLPCAPSVTGFGRTVRAMKASPDGRVLYVGGSFNHVGSTTVSSVFALNTADCSVRKNFLPGMSATVRAIDTTDNAVYLGGDFDRVNGLVRQRVAAVAPTGALLPFTARIDRSVRALSAAPQSGRIFVGGDFESVNGQPARSLVALHPATGATVLAYPDWFPPQSSVKTIARDKSRFYVGAEGHGPGIYDGRIAGLLANGTMVWNDTCRGATQSVVPYKGVLYSASHAHDCNETPGGFPDRGDRQHLLAQSLDDRTILHWFPDSNGGLGEQVGPRALAVARDILWVGGEFTEINERPQQGITRFGSVDTGAPKVPALKLSATEPGKVTLGWRATWDRDDAALTYRVYRDGKVVSRQTKRSTYWDLPDMTYTDSVGAGTRHTYSIEVTDGTNTSPKSRSLTVTVPPKATARAAGDDVTGRPKVTKGEAGNPQ